ncbi:MAG: glycosyltransferase family 2 protein [Patescibacteria group bacterium]|jgi:glycosyltransferase involved in cell wall biosynthesis
MPFLSVVMPTYNRADLLPEVLASYFSQRETDFELILVDDSSTDSTAAYATTVRDQRFRYVQNTGQKGVGGARDAGVRAATGEIIVVADSDDPSYPTRLQCTAQHFRTHPGTDVFYTNFDLWYVDTGEIRPRFFQPFVRELLGIINFIPNASSAYRRSVYLERTAGYDPSLEIGEDYDLWLALAEQGATFDYDRSQQVRVRMHSDSVRAQKQDRHRSFLHQIRKKHGLPELPSVERLRELAEPEVAAFFTSPEKYALWFT